VRTVALDKTGTLTLGLPRLEREELLDEVAPDEALRLAASLERGSEHPLAGALVREARERELALAEPRAFRALPGRGVEGEIDGRRLWAGSSRLAQERTGSPVLSAEAMEQEGRTAIVLGAGVEAIAVFGLADPPRAEAAMAVRALGAAGVEHVVVLSGDGEPVVRSVAERCGIGEWRSGLLPEEKLRAIADLGEGVAMVGDGINDAPALAAARVGVAMGVAGSDVALEAADVALMSDDLGQLPRALRLAQRARRVMVENIWASLAVKVAVVALAPLGLLTLWAAVVADMGMSLLVTFNALALLRVDRGQSAHRTAWHHPSGSTAPAPLRRQA
jgi:Cd2+/Zn2+-exporting ATPase